MTFDHQPVLGKLCLLDLCSRYVVCDHRRRSWCPEQRAVDVWRKSNEKVIHDMESSPQAVTLPIHRPRGLL